MNSSGALNGYVDPPARETEKVRTWAVHDARRHSPDDEGERGAHDLDK